MRAIATIAQVTAIPATAPVDNLVDFSDIADSFVIEPFESVDVGAVLVVDSAEGL